MYSKQEHITKQETIEYFDTITQRINLWIQKSASTQNIQ